MPKIADYTIITDNKFIIQTGGDIDYTRQFSLESGAVLGARSILAFVVFVNSGNVLFEVKINGSSQIVQGVHALNGSKVHTLHEVINAGVLKAGTNEIEFRITFGFGSLQFGDVVLWWQREV